MSGIRAALALDWTRHLALVLLLGSGCAARLSAVDELLAWDDFESYAAGTITTTAGSPFAGGDGWATSGSEVGWEVANHGSSTPPPLALLGGPGLVAGSNILLSTQGTFSVQRILLPMAPTAAQPIWMSVLIKGHLMQNVAADGVSPDNAISFWNGAWGTPSFSINTVGTRTDGSSTPSTAPIRWRLDNVDETPSTTLAVDENIHLLVVEVTTSQLSLWVFPTATPSASTISSTPAMTTEALSGTLHFDRVSFWVAVKGGLTPDPAVLEIDDVNIGTSETAVTASGMPHVTGLAPTAGVVTGGDALAITGSGFDGTSQVTLGGNAATAVAETGGSALSCLTPGSTSGLGAVDVVVSNSVGSVLHPGSFTYQAATTADPSNTAPPTIDDSAGTAPGSSWIGSSGSWSPTPSGFGYVWQTSPDDSGADATTISGATASTYAVAAGDIGNWLRLAVTPAGSSHVAYSAFVQVTIAKGSGTSSTSATGTAASGTGASYAGAVTGGTAGSSCGLGAAAGVLLTPLLLRTARRRGTRARPSP